MHGSTLDDGTADRLLSGRLAPDDAPPGYAAVASVLRAAGGPLDAWEGRIREDVVLSAAALAASQAPVPEQRGHAPMRRAFLPFKVAAASVVGALSLATAAAAVGVNLAGDHSHRPSPGAHASPASNVTGAAAVAVTGTSGAPSGSATGTGAHAGTGSAAGPVQGMATGHATFGLCTAFLAARGATGTSPGKMATSVAFKALLNKVAGGTASAAAAFCTAYVASHRPGRPATAGTTGGQAPGKRTMPPASHPTPTTHPGTTPHPGPPGHPTPATRPGATSHASATTHPGH